MHSFKRITYSIQISIRAFKMPYIILPLHFITGKFTIILEFKE